MANAHPDYKARRLLWWLAVLLMIIVIAYALLYVFQRLGPAGQQPYREIASEQASDSKMIGAPNDSVSSGEAPAERSLAEPSSTKLPNIGQKLIKTADMEIKVKEGTFEHAFVRAEAIAKGSGGYVTSSNTAATDTELKSGYMTIRVPAGKFDGAIEALKKLGDVQKVNIAGQDVSEEYADLESRLRNLRAQESLLLRLLDQAKTVEDGIAVERRLSEIQGEIEQLTGRKQFLDNQVDYSTITVYLYEPSVQQTKIDWGLVEALRQAVLAFVRTINGIIMALGTLGPIILILGLAWWIAIRRRHAG